MWKKRKRKTEIKVEVDKMNWCIRQCMEVTYGVADHANDLNTHLIFNSFFVKYSGAHDSSSLLVGMWLYWEIALNEYDVSSGKLRYSAHKQ